MFDPRGAAGVGGPGDDDDDEPPIGEPDDGDGDYDGDEDDDEEPPWVGGLLSPRVLQCSTRTEFLV